MSEKYDLALEHGQILQNVERTTWFKELLKERQK